MHEYDMIWWCMFFLLFFSNSGKNTMPRVNKNKQFDINNYNVFQVDEILGKRFAKNRVEYLLKWHGYNE